jgi:hypothetical protein
MVLRSRVIAHDDADEERLAASGFGKGIDTITLREFDVENADIGMGCADTRDGLIVSGGLPDDSVLSTRFDHFDEAFADEG